VNDPLGTELSAAARRLIADARGGDDPNAEDEARVKARWLAGIAAGAGVSSLSEAVRAAASTGWGLKVGALAAGLAAAAAGVYLGWPQVSEYIGDAASEQRERAPQAAPSAPAPRAPEPQAPEPTVEPPAPAVPAPEPPEAVAAPVPAAEPPAPAAAPEVAAEAARAPEAARPAPPRPRATAHRAVPASRVVPARAARELPAAPAASGQLGEELSMISQIRGQLQSGAPGRALEQLAEYRRRFEQPNLAMEADALRVDALCQAGERDGARAAATDFTAKWPASPLQQRVSAACP
jgi:outer membrane biosynthesis protein TonB